MFGEHSSLCDRDDVEQSILSAQSGGLNYRFNQYDCADDLYTDMCQAANRFMMEVVNSQNAVCSPPRYFRRLNGLRRFFEIAPHSGRSRRVEYLIGMIGDIESLLGKIHHGDCIEGLKHLPDQVVDLAFADPPFNIGYKYDTYVDRRESEHYLDWCREWMSQVNRVLKPDGTFWLAIGDEYAAELKIEAQKLGFITRSWVVWYYTFGVHCKTKFAGRTLICFTSSKIANITLSIEKQSRFRRLANWSTRTVGPTLKDESRTILGFYAPRIAPEGSTPKKILGTSLALPVRSRNAPVFTAARCLNNCSVALFALVPNLTRLFSIRSPAARPPSSSRRSSIGDSYRSSFRKITPNAAWNDWPPFPSVTFGRGGRTKSFRPSTAEAQAYNTSERLEKSQPKRQDHFSASPRKKNRCSVALGFSYAIQYRQEHVQ